MSSSLLRAQGLLSKTIDCSCDPVSSSDSISSPVGSHYPEGKYKVQTSQHLVITNLNIEKKARNNQKESLQLQKEQIVLPDLLKFYSITANLEQLLKVLRKRSKISLRILDWFVTNYAKEFRVIYAITRCGQTKHFDVYHNYKAQLKAFHKKLFDPFCRHRRIWFEYSDDSEIETTVGQLNFFRWAIRHKVLDYVAKNLKRITAHMALKNIQIRSDPVPSDLDSLQSDLESSQTTDSSTLAKSIPTPTKSIPSITIEAFGKQLDKDTTQVVVAFKEG